MSTTKPAPAPNTAVATTSETAPRLVAVFEKNRERILGLLPKGVSLEHVITAVRLEAMKNPQIAQCTAISLLQTAGKIMQWGLEIGETAYMVPFRTKIKGVNGAPDQWELRCTAVMGYTGVAELMIASGAVRAVEAECVYEQDEFSFELGSNAQLRHRPTSDRANRGALVGAYCILRLPMGQSTFRFMSIGEIEEIRTKHSKQWGPDKVKDCPPWYARKTAVIHTGKLMPKNRRMAQAFQVIDDAEAELEGIEHVDAEIRPVAPASSDDWALDDEEPAQLVAGTEPHEELRV